MSAEPTREERLYRYTVRTLYIIALALNAVIIWDQVKTTPEGKALGERFSTAKAKALGKLKAAKDLRDAESWVLFEAMTILEENGTTPDA
jgi:hypothetical protein